MPIPLPIFDLPEYLAQPMPTWLQQHLQDLQLDGVLQEYALLKQFLLSYAGSSDTFTSYRREVERFAQWTWLLQAKLIKQVNSEDIRVYMQFVQSPPTRWVSRVHSKRFADDATGIRVPLAAWRPFLLRSQHKRLRDSTRYDTSPAALRAIMAGVSTLYTFLLHERYVLQNPMSMLRQKNRILQQSQQRRVTRKLSSVQWQRLIEVLRQHADIDPNYNRHVFIFSAFYLLGLRISELAYTELSAPKMGDFFQDKTGRWWFATVGKGNKYREIAVADAMLDCLGLYRRSLGLSQYPSADDHTPIIPKQKGRGGIGVRQLRKIVQQGFDLTIASLNDTGHNQEAEDMRSATVHWLRHTAISADVQNRPREHVRDDAGHSSVVTTDRYIEIDLIARHDSAKDKVILPDEDK